MRGGLTIGAGIIAGNILGFFRVALTAYLLGTDSYADALAVAIGPLDALNQVITNSTIFAFVPMLTEQNDDQRAALFLRLRSVFFRVFLAVSLVMAVFAGPLIRMLAPGLAPEFFDDAVWNLRIAGFSSMAAGVAALHAALLYTARRFAPSAFYQAALNVGTIGGAVLLWKLVGVHAFAIGYMCGAFAQLAIVWLATRKELPAERVEPADIPLKTLLAKPAPIFLYAGLLSLNVVSTRAYATHAGPGAAAALDYCLRCVGVPLAFLVSPITNSLLPEIARLASLSRIRESFRLITKTMALGAVAAIAACVITILVRKPVITLLFQRGSFTAQSTELVSAVLLGFAPSLIGWSLLEIGSRSLFAMKRPRLPVVASAIPVMVNVVFMAMLREPDPTMLGVGASAGFLLGFLGLAVVAYVRRNRWVGPE